MTSGYPCPLRVMDKKLVQLKYSLIHGAFWMSVCVIINYANVYLLFHGFRDSQIGTVIAAGGLIASLIQAAVASIADRSEKITSRHIVIVIALLCVLSAASILLFARSIVSVGILYVLLVVLIQTTMPLLNSMGMEFVNFGGTLNFGAARGVGSFAFALMSLLIGRFLEGRSPDLILVIGISLFLLLIVVSLFFRFPKVSPDTAARDESVSAARAPSPPIRFSEHRFLLFLIGVALIYAAFMVINQFLFQIVRNIGGTSRDMGVVLALCGFLELPPMFLFEKIAKKTGVESLIRLSGFFFSVKIFLTYLVGSVPVLFCVQLTQIFGYAVFTPASVYYVNQISAETETAKNQARLGAAITFGGVVGAYLGGLAIESFGVSSAILIFAIVSVIGTGLICATCKKSPLPKT